MVSIIFAVPHSMSSPFGDRSRLLHHYRGILTCALCRSLHWPSVLPPLVFPFMKLPRSCSAPSTLSHSFPSRLCVQPLRPQRRPFSLGHRIAPSSVHSCISPSRPGLTLRMLSAVLLLSVTAIAQSIGPRLCAYCAIARAHVPSA
jgi:hypothetical protein